jgi:phosphatidylinositol-3-phosphatase
LCLLAAATASTALAQKGGSKGVPHLDHVWMIMMENHGFTQIYNNPNAPFLNKLANSANMATNYFAVGHPSLTNYLEVVGGSNFGNRSDNSPNWQDQSCSPDIESGSFTLEGGPSVCPIAGSGMDAETPALDSTNETQVSPCTAANGALIDLDGTLYYPSAPTVGKTIADQLYEHRKSWKSYQESLPPAGADKVNTNDGYFSNLTDFSSFISGGSFSQWTVQGISIPPVASQSDAQGISSAYMR